MDEFKKYVFENRDKLDVESPGAQVWQNISSNKIGVAGKTVSMFSKWAAAASILVAATVVIYFSIQKQPAAKPVAKVTVEPQKQSIPEVTGRTDSLSHLSSSQSSEQVIVLESKESNSREINNTVQKRYAKRISPAKKPQSAVDALQENYATIINHQLKKLNATPIYAEDADYFHMFKKQWYDLENDEKEIRKDVQLYGLTDNVVEHLINIYQEKLSLLKQLQAEINKMNNRVKQNPTGEQQSPSYMKL